MRCNVRHILPIFCLVLLASYAYSQNTQITSFSKSKKLLLKVYKDNPVTLYCGCSFKGKKPDLSSCGYIPKKDRKRANRIEWEHVVPAHAFGQSFSEWRKGHPKCVSKKGKKFKGRKCAQKINEEYGRMQADMFNLYPAIGEVNGRRSNYSMAIIKGEKREFGKCDVEIKNKKVEPKESIRGEIARTYMYMDSVYFPDCRVKIEHICLHSSIFFIHLSRTLSTLKLLPILLDTLWMTIPPL